MSAAGKSEMFKVIGCAIITDLVKRIFVSGEIVGSDGASVNSTVMWKFMPCSVAEIVENLKLKAVRSSETSADLYHTACVSHPRRRNFMVTIVNVKVALEEAIKAQSGRRDMPTLSLTSAQDGVVGQRHVSAALPPGMRLGTNRIGGWAGNRAGLDGCENSRPTTGTRSPDHSARSQSLYRLSHPGPHSVHN